MKRIVPAVLILLAFGFFVASCSRQDNRRVNAFEALPRPGTPVPAFDGSLLHTGTSVSNDSLLGSPVVIALWSTTCYGSRQSIAALQNLFKTYEPRGVRFLILAADENRDYLTQFVDSARLDIPVAHSPDVRAFDFSDQAHDTNEYRVLFALPSFLVIDPQGTVVTRSGGMLVDSVLISALDSLTTDSDQRAGAAITLAAAQPEYRWERLTEHAAFPPSYNFPVHVDADGRFVALHSEGTWVSRNARGWTRGALPFSGMNSAYLRYVQHNGATWALGNLRGNYERFSIDPVIRRTTDYERWETVGRAASLPGVVFYAAASFLGDLWILGGYDGSDETASVWRSSDGLEWRKVAERAPWSPREGATAIVFRDRLFLIGGGELDGAQYPDVWSTADGVEWRRETERISPTSMGGTPVVFDDRLWLVGVNRNNGFSPGILVTDDGVTWREETAPWSPRGAVAVWTDGANLYMTGGKYSTVEGGETIFMYHNDVWRMRRVSDQ